jgi:hypothetical protein
VLPAGTWFGRCPPRLPLDALRLHRLPGFEFSGFELGDTARLLAQFPWRGRRSSRSRGLTGPAAWHTRPPALAPHRIDRSGDRPGGRARGLALGREPLQRTEVAGHRRRRGALPAAARARGPQARSGGHGRTRPSGRVAPLLAPDPRGDPLVDPGRTGPRRRLVPRRAGASRGAVASAGGLASGWWSSRRWASTRSRASFPRRRERLTSTDAREPDFVASVLRVTAPLTVVAALRARSPSRALALVSFGSRFSRSGSFARSPRCSRWSPRRRWSSSPRAPAEVAAGWRWRSGQRSWWRRFRSSAARCPRSSGPLVPGLHRRAARRRGALARSGAGDGGAPLARVGAGTLARALRDRPGLRRPPPGLEVHRPAGTPPRRLARAAPGVGRGRTRGASRALRDRLRGGPPGGTLEGWASPRDWPRSPPGPR